MEPTGTLQQQNQPRMPRRFLSFTTFVWAFVAGAFVIAILWPVISGMIVLQTWQKVPCRLNGVQYFYEFQGQKYYSERLDLWDRFHLESHLVPNDNPFSEANSFCYVNPGNPMQSVLYPNAIERKQNAGPRLLAWCLLAVAAVLITIKVKRQSAAQG